MDNAADIELVTYAIKHIPRDSIPAISFSRLEAHAMPTFRTRNFPTSGAHPNIIQIFRNSNRCSKYFNSSALLPASSSFVLPNSCHHAPSDQTSLPEIMPPLSSINKPIRRGLIRRGVSLSHCLHLAIALFAKMGTPQHSEQSSLSRWYREKVFSSTIVRLK